MNKVKLSNTFQVERPLKKWERIRSIGGARHIKQSDLILNEVYENVKILSPWQKLMFGGLKSYVSPERALKNEMSDKLLKFIQVTTLYI